MIQLKIVTRIAVVLSSFIASTDVFGLPDTLLDQRLFRHTIHYTILTQQVVHQRANATARHGTVNLNTHPTYGHSYGMRIEYNPHPRIALNSGLFLGFLRTCYSFTTDFNAVYQAPSIFEGLDVWKQNEGIYAPFGVATLGLTLRQRLGKRLKISVGYDAAFSWYQTGIYLSNFGISTDQNQVYNLGTLILQNRQERLYFTHHLHSGLIVVLPNMKFLKASVVIGLNQYNKISGSYDVLINTADASNGSYQVRMNYLGLELGYVFTRVKRVRKD